MSWLLTNKNAAPRGVWYHGSSIKNLRSILAQGLIPEVKQKNWHQDEGASVHKPSREAYGGIYVTTNMSTATGSPLDRTNEGRVLLVTMELQPNTFYLDEDDINGELSHALQNVSENDYYVAPCYIAMTQPNVPANASWREAIPTFRDQYIEDCIQQWKYRQEFNNKEPIHPELEARVRELLPDTWKASVTRLAAHLAVRMKDYDVKSRYMAVFPDADYDTIPSKEELFPTVAEGEKEFRDASEKLTRVMRITARPNPKSEFNTARVSTPIGYSGSNVITSVLEIRDSRKYRGEDWKKPCSIIVHYGEPPADFFRQWKERVGAEYVIEKPGQADKAASLEGVDGWEDFEFRTATGAKPNGPPPARTGAGDPILYHGTSATNATQIEREGFRGDDLGYVGFGVTPGAVQPFAVMTGGPEARYLGFVLDRDWLREHALVINEGNHRNLYLLTNPEGGSLRVPLHAIKDMWDVTEDYLEGKLKTGSSPAGALVDWRNPEAGATITLEALKREDPASADKLLELMRHRFSRDFTPDLEKQVRVKWVSPDKFDHEENHWAKPGVKEQVAQMAQEMEQGKKFGPAVYLGGQWEDGNHRVKAARKLGLTLVPAVDMRGFSADFDEQVEDQRLNKIEEAQRSNHERTQREMEAIFAELDAMDGFKKESALNFEPWIGVDLDGTVAQSIDDYSDPTLIGLPIEAMVAKVRLAISYGERFKVFTARMADKEKAELIREAIGDWTEKYIGTRLDATNEKDPGMLEIWDDKARQVIENTGEMVRVATRLKPLPTSKQVTTSKGLKLTIKFEPHNEFENSFWGIAVNEAGDDIATVSFGHNSNSDWSGRETWSAMNAWVDKEYRRKGVATAIYDAFDATGRLAIPSGRYGQGGKLSPDGSDFWRTRKLPRQKFSQEIKQVAASLAGGMTEFSNARQQIDEWVTAVKKAGKRLPRFDVWVTKHGGPGDVLIEMERLNENNEDYLADMWAENAEEDGVEFEVYVAQELEAAYNHVAERLNQLPEKITVYRSLDLPGGVAQLQHEGAGVYWSLDESASKTFGDGPNQHTLRGVVSATDVNWDETIMMNMDPASGGVEQELRLDEGADVTITGIRKGKKPWSAPKGMTVTAAVEAPPATRPVTETPSFKAWFAGSEVVDQQGKPMVMYHATQTDIGEFHAYTHFGTQQAANDRHRDTTEFYDQVLKHPTRSQGSNIIPVYLSIKNALRLPDLASIDSNGEEIDPDAEEDEEDDNRPYTRAWEGDEDLSVTLLEMGVIDIDEFEDHRAPEAAFELLAEKGYDGVVYENKVEDPGNDSWIVFSPSQVKSAIGNSGAFDSGKTSITAAVEEETPSITWAPAFQKWFRGSQVVDHEGKPLMVFHGTHKDFDSFQTPAYFTTNPDEAAGYAQLENSIHERNVRKRKTWVPLPAGLTVGQHLDIWDQSAACAEDWEGGAGVPFGVGDSILIKRKGGYDYVEGYHLDDDYNIAVGDSPDAKRDFAETDQYVEESLNGGRSGHVMPCYLRILNPKEIRDPMWGNRFTTGRWSAEEEAKAREEIKELIEQGYDGIKTFSDQGALMENTEIEQWIVFSPKQVKSAIANSGEFDLEKASMTAAKTASGAGCDWRSNKTKTVKLLDFEDDFEDYLVLIAQFGEHPEYSGRTGESEPRYGSPVPVHYMPTRTAMKQIKSWGMAGDDGDDRGEPHIAAMMESIQSGMLIPPAITNNQDKVLDGRHRIYAADRLKIPQIPYIRIGEALVAERGSKQAAWTPEGRRGELGMMQDNPAIRYPEEQEQGEQWLASHPRATTAWYEKVLLPPSLLTSLPGARDEHLAPDKRLVDELTESMKREGFRDQNQPLVVVEQDGQPKIYEGNHRVRAAEAAGLPLIPVTVRYFGGSEMIPGVWDPATLPITKKAREGWNEEGFWAGEGNGASGVLPIAQDTKRICLAWRSYRVHQGDCWGTLGGAIKKGMSPAESAKVEMQEEVGYSGAVTLHPGFVFKSGSFQYYNFIGVVASEFPFSPHPKHAKETDSIAWFTLEEIDQDMKNTPGDFHPGVVSLFKNSRQLIEQLAGGDEEPEPEKKQAMPKRDFIYTKGQERMRPTTWHKSKMYHFTRRAFRESILQHGLLCSKATPMFRMGLETEGHKGVFLESAPLRHKYPMPEDPNNDFWEVNVEGLKLQRDDTLTTDEDTPGYEDGIEWWVTYDEDIPPSRLKLLEPEPKSKNAARKRRWYTEADLVERPNPDSPPNTYVKQRWLHVESGGPTFMTLFKLPQPLHKLLAEGTDQEFSPDQIKVAQEFVSIAGVEHFLTHPDALNAYASTPTIVAQTRTGVWLLDGNHRATAAKILGRNFKAKYLDLTGYDLDAQYVGDGKQAGRNKRQTLARKVASVEDLTSLANYLSLTPREVGEELARNSTEMFHEYLEEEDPELLETLPFDGDDYLEDYSAVPDNILIAFGKQHGDWLMQHDPGSAPLFLHAGFEGMVENQWLVHFTNDAEAIATQGFTHGVWEMDRLGLTSYIQHEHKAQGGYNFAFGAEDARSAFGGRHGGGTKYGRECVLFRASGVKVYHYGDEETQIIFWGKDARDIIPIARNHYNNDWCLPEGPDGEPLFAGDDLEAAIKWAIDNFARYRGVLTKTAAEQGPKVPRPYRAVTKSPAFKRWFAGSKVVDGRGTPLPVYHGTRHDFEIFDQAKSGQNTSHPTTRFGFFFSAAPELAHLFMKTTEDKEPVEGSHIKVCFLSIKNPLVLTHEQFGAFCPSQQEKEGMPEKIQEKLNLLQEFTAKLEGHDGIQVLKNPSYKRPKGWWDTLWMFDEYSRDTWIAFEPNQIKSALGNTGEFSSDQSSILASGKEAGAEQEFTFKITKRPGGYAVRAYDPLVDDIQVGYLLLNADDYKPDMAFVNDVKVDQDYRRQGIGTLLYDKAIALARRKGFKRFGQGIPRTDDAAHVWKRLAERYRVEHVDSIDFISLTGPEKVAAIDPADVEIANDCYDYHHQEQFCKVTAEHEGAVIGNLSYGIFQDEIHIKMIEVDQKLRRIGIASGMMDKLRTVHPGMPINWGGLTPEGAALKAKVHRPADEPPNRLLSDIEALRPELARVAQDCYNDWPDIEFIPGSGSPAELIMSDLAGAVYRETRGQAFEEQVNGETVLNCEDHRHSARLSLPSSLVQEKVGDTWRKRKGVVIKPEDFIITEVKTASKQAADPGQDPGQFQLVTESPGFRQWFQDSVVVDSKGRPLPVFHGTKRNFKVFDPKALGRNTKHLTSRLGFFFSAAPEIADMFAGKDKWKMYTKGAHIKPCFLSIKNPLVITHDEFNSFIAALPEKMEKKWFPEQIEERTRRFEEFTARLSGHDGIQILKNPNYKAGDKTWQFDELGRDTWVAFDPAQIKSAIGNNGEFSPDNPSITASKTAAAGKNPPAKPDANYLEGSNGWALYPDQRDGAYMSAPVMDMINAETDQRDVPTPAENWVKMGTGTAVMDEPTVAPSITESPAFQRWFGDSKVVDEQGNPMVMYHGTKASFDEFQWGDIGFHFGELHQAEAILRQHRTVDRGTSVNIMPVYLKITNPLKTTDAGAWENVYRTWEVCNRALKGALATNPKRTRHPAGFLENWKPDPRVVPAFEEEPAGEHIDFERREQWGKDAMNSLRATLEKLGYDGIVYNNRVEGKGKSWIAFHPNQIKSAIGNDGKFDPASNSITASVTEDGDVTYEPEIKLDDMWPGYIKGGILTGADFEKLYVIPLPYRKLAYIEELQVPEMARRDGLGTSLVNEFLTQAAALGAEACLLQVIAYEVPEAKVVKFYRSLGFERLKYNKREHDNPPLMMIKVPCAPQPAAKTGAESPRSDDCGTCGHPAYQHMVPGPVQTFACRQPGCDCKKWIQKPAAVPVEETPEFKQWFGASKIVDKQGQPMKMYHGTRWAFQEFKNSRTFPTQYFFTPDYAHAERYSEDDDNYDVFDHYEEKPGKPRVLACYLRVLNPFDPRKAAHRKIMIELGADTRKGYEYGVYHFFETHGEEIHKMGYDGIWMREVEPGNYDTLVVFDSSQIKSATSKAFGSTKNIYASAAS